MMSFADYDRCAEVNAVAAARIWARRVCRDLEWDMHLHVPDKHTQMTRLSVLEVHCNIDMIVV